MRELVPGTVEGILHVRHSEPSVPDGQGPMSDDRRVRFERWVERATGAINRKQRKHRVLARRCGGSSHGNFNSSVMEAGVEKRPTVSHPYMTASTAAMRAMSVVLTPVFLRALYLWMQPPRPESL